MSSLSADEMVRVWERGETLQPQERALAVLAACFRERSAEALADLPLGARNALLLRVWGNLFGPSLDGFAECPRCRDRLEFALPRASLEASEEPLSGEYQLSEGEYDLRFRLPTSRDLSAMAGCADVAQGRALLLRRCVLEAARAGVLLPIGALPDSMTAAVAERMSMVDPLAETLLDLVCNACGHRWQAHLEIAEFVWTMLAAQARRLLREVHALARAYGWREADILAMSAARRQCYLEMVG
jgi:hypothetical protein